MMSFEEDHDYSIGIKRVLSLAAMFRAFLSCPQLKLRNWRRHSMVIQLQRKVCTCSIFLRPLLMRPLLAYYSGCIASDYFGYGHCSSLTEPSDCDSVKRNPDLDNSAIKAIVPPMLHPPRKFYKPLYYGV